MAVHTGSIGVFLSPAGRRACGIALRPWSSMA